MHRKSGNYIKTGIVKCQLVSKSQGTKARPPRNGRVKNIEKCPNDTEWTGQTEIVIVYSEAIVQTLVCEHLFSTLRSYTEISDVVQVARLCSAVNYLRRPI